MDKENFKLTKPLYSLLTWFPAVMLEMAQAASLTRFALGCLSRAARTGSAPAEMTASVWSSLPVTTLPSARREGVTTDSSPQASFSARISTAPAETTSWILSLSPSVR